MALQQWDAWKESIIESTGLSPATIFTIVALAVAFYYAISGFFPSSDHGHHQRSRDFEEQTQALPPPVQLGEVTEEELKEYDGSDPKKPLLMAIKGQIYDVSQSRMFYGPGGPYALFAGKDASRALAKLSFEEKDLTGDISGLGAFELDALQDWEYKFMSKYVKVGTVKQAVPPVNDGEANDGSVEATDGEAKPAEGDASGSAKPLEDDGPSKGSKACADAPSETVATESAVKSEADVDKKD
ncbi:LOW QUALITY PROTEIN: membrane steroid-binding protein 2-like [Solanum tuberosum]|uniref:LOW QUALITY PROTEIN: membrane steroid-binding protein 2-like n=1 Tax=Solanum tuberosum TaxID=4113 RepID=UPI00073A1E17|nr:PREDICTED: LOW QUALITY PROTEIN: membrane steroid-binding protein 2-like [Solanum tuberosum]